MKIKSYKGEFKSGLKNGNGIEYYIDGDYYIGTFLDNYKHGQGNNGQRKLQSYKSIQ